tara:strand:+ start:22448 stop:23062 length:615 start_codon:yes stop_codon:yes gene_type:complete
MRIIILFTFISTFSYSQKHKLVLGNSNQLCIFDDTLFVINDSLPPKLSEYKSIYIFSNSSSILSLNDAITISKFVQNGGGLYLGAENWPLQAESNQLTLLLFNKEAYGEYDGESAESKSKNVNLKLNELEEVTPGNTTIAFPLDYRLKVEAWIEDQPLILSGEIGKGRIIIDGGYSRFYCTNWNDGVAKIMTRFGKYLEEGDSG